MLKLVSKHKTTELVFTTQKVLLNSKKVWNVLDIFDITKIEITIARKLKTCAKKNKN